MSNSVRKKWTSVYQIVLVLVIVVSLNILANLFNISFDLTSDKRFTLSQSTEDIINKVENPALIRVYLDGEFPAGFKRLQSSTKSLLNELRDLNPNIHYEFEDPNSGTVEEANEKQKQLIDNGVLPISLQYFDGTEYSQKSIFPYAILNLKGRKILINLLEHQQLGQDQDIVLNNSVSLLEYKFANAFQKVQYDRQKKIAFTDGHGELISSSTLKLERELRKYYGTGRIYLDSLIQIDTTIDVLIIAGPREEFDTKDLFKIDQYLMNGGRIMWLVDKLNPELDSINKYKFYVPQDIITGLDELLFKYGVRLEPNLVMDMECSSIPQVVGMQGDQPQLQLFNWYYHPLVTSKSEHPIVKNIDRVNLYFPSSIDTVQTEGPIRKTPLLVSSDYSRVQYNPMRLSFEILKLPPDPKKFNKPNQVMSILLEGRFISAFKNRVPQQFRNTLSDIGMQYQELSPETKQIVVAESDFIRNMVSQDREIGYNMWDKQYYKGNKDFIINSIEYLLDDDNILDSRSKEIKLRLLDRVRTSEEKTKWQFVNIGLPLLFLLLFGVGYHYLRRRKYT